MSNLIPSEYIYLQKKGEKDFKNFFLDLLWERGCELRKRLVSLDIIGEKNGLETFAVKRNFAEIGGSSPMSYITDRLDVSELQVDDMLAKSTAESTKKYILIREIKF